MRRALTLIAVSMLAVAACWAQPIDPVQWTIAVEPATVQPGGATLVRVKATVEEGWHLYSSTTPQGSPIALNLRLADSDAIASWKAHQPEPEVKFDPNFQMDSEWYVGEAEFLIETQLAESAASGVIALVAELSYGACDATRCLPPARRKLEATLTVDAAAAGAPPTVPAGHQAMKVFPARKPKVSSAPAAASPAERPAAAGAGDQGLASFAAVAFGFGLLAIFTPCVFPMIPITMSFFMSTQSGEKKASLVQATTFCVGVIVLFTGMGAGVSAALGPFGMTQLGSNVWVNLFIALIFFAFGASLMGAFEITMPSGAMTSLNRLTGSGGIFATLMMGLVFALASFACTGPFVGALLAGSIQGGMAWPIFGMLMFSSGLAAPFFLLALFPSYLDRLPKSGGWLARTKITMGFLILAAAFKYLSNVDQMYQLHYLSRERFLAIWAVLFSLAGLYLLGLLKLEDGDSDRIGLGRLSVAAVFLVTALSLIPGMFGAPLGELDAYVPSSTGSSWGAAAGGAAAGSGSHWIKDDYPAALAEARQSGKPVLINFTGYACTNCKWMKTNMFPRPEIAESLDSLVLLELYTDALDDVSELNQKLQLERFQTVTIPYYAVVDADENTLGEFSGSTRDAEAFRTFLLSGREPTT